MNKNFFAALWVLIMLISGCANLEEAPNGLCCKGGGEIGGDC
jgi:hypothetical protein